MRIVKEELGMHTLAIGKPLDLGFFENFAIDYFTFAALHSADKFSNEQQIFGLTF